MLLPSLFVRQNMDPLNANPSDPVAGFSAIARNFTGLGAVMKRGGYKTFFAGKCTRSVRGSQRVWLCDVATCYPGACRGLWNGDQGPHTHGARLRRFADLFPPHERRKIDQCEPPTTVGCLGSAHTHTHVARA